MEKLACLATCALLLGTRQAAPGPDQSFIGTVGVLRWDVTNVSAVAAKKTLYPIAKRLAANFSSVPAYFVTQDGAEKPSVARLCNTQRVDKVVVLDADVRLVQFFDTEYWFDALTLVVVRCSDFTIQVDETAIGGHEKVLDKSFPSDAAFSDRFIALGAKLERGEVSKSPPYFLSDGSGDGKRWP